MRIAHSVKITVFAKPEDDADKIKAKLKELIPFDLEKEKIVLDQKTAKGFDNREITIFEVILTKEQHTNLFLKNLINNLSEESKELILRQAETRLDKDYNFFLRLSKDKLINENEFWVTDAGNCFHIKINLAVFPKKMEKALELIKELFQKI